MKIFLTAAALLSAPAFGWTGQCYEDGRSFASEVASIDYCEKSAGAPTALMKEVGAEEICDTREEVRALRSGCEDTVINAIEELYESGECQNFRRVSDSRVQRYSLMKRLCK